MNLEKIKKGLLRDNYKLRAVDPRTNVICVKGLTPSYRLKLDVMNVTPVGDSIYKVIFVFVSSISDKKINWFSLLVNPKLYKAVIELIQNLKFYYRNK